ncbi:MAG TPA: alpha-D-ribose 1-methylphosphonate 5-triphosphate diphosphatase [Burkholderiaceae bacterium]|nr:alpha-D-ribose 1-methylphosphonate 5-triphosphate diphosphatase [Burkholderiaceae bacterium]
MLRATRAAQALAGIQGSRILTPAGIEPASFAIHDQMLGMGLRSPSFLDAGDLLVLPGIVDLHGDAFERSLSPRPGVRLPHALALADVDTQLLANGITTAFHGVTLSWEGGLRGLVSAQRMLDALANRRHTLGADHRLHLRLEARSEEGPDVAQAWVDAGTVHLLSINDHWAQLAAQLDDPARLSRFAERAECDMQTFLARLEAAGRREPLPQSIVDLVATARRRGLSVASHDDADPQTRRRMSAIGCNIAEFPLNEATARQARSSGDLVVFGAPNVLRGGSHVGAPGAEAMVLAGLCDVLSSDYHYPSPLLAALDLAKRDVVSLPMAWNLVSLNPAQAAGLDDRGSMKPGRRADFLLVDDSADHPKVIACVVAGRVRHASSGPCFQH